jgi:hypothetical protein
MGRRSVAGMPKLVHPIVSVLARRFRSLAVLELENLALRHQLHVSSSPATRSASTVPDLPFALGLALPIMAALSGRDGVGQTGNGHSMAPSGLPPLLTLALEIRTTIASRSS